MGSKYFPETSMLEFSLKGMGKSYKAYICLCYTPSLTQYLETVKYLHSKELEYFTTLKFERRIISYLAGRYAGKRAVASFLGEENYSQVYIESGIFNQPIVIHPNRSNIQLSITHCDYIGAAITFPETLPMGIDIERISSDGDAVLETQMTIREKELIQSSTYSETAGLTLLWTAKEALSKILKTGITTPFKVFEVSRIETKDNVVISYFKNFPQYCTVSFMFKQYVCSITYPKIVELDTQILRDLSIDIKNSFWGLSHTKNLDTSKI